MPAKRKYFIAVPRIVLSYCASAYDLALWVVIKDIAGEQGVCFLSTPNLAKLSHMSTGQVSKTRSRLIQMGAITGERKRLAGSTQYGWHLTIPDLWEDNEQWCLEHPKIRQRVQFADELKDRRKSPKPH